MLLTEIIDVKACFIQGTRIKLKTNYCKDYDGKKEEESNIDKRSNGLGNGWHHNLKT